MSEANENYTKVKSILTVSMILCWLTMMASFIFYIILYASAPRSPTPSHSVEMCEHGTYFYIRPWQSFVFHFMLICGFLGMAILGLVYMFLKKMRYHIKCRLLFLEVLITGFIFVVGIFAVQLSGFIAMFFANSQPETSPWRFWLLPVIVVPMWVLIIYLGFYTWTLVIKRLTHPQSTPDEQSS